MLPFVVLPLPLISPNVVVSPLLLLHYMCTCLCLLNFKGLYDPDDPKKWLWWQWNIYIHIINVQYYPHTHFI